MSCSCGCDGNCGCGPNSKTCGCCQGIHASTPQPIDNRPGLPALNYRVGTHGAFLETMKARLSSPDFPALNRLTTRDPSDASIAMLDAWATVGDVLSFYTERIANEGYLRTATERRSVLELGRLVGYTPRPGVAASIFLAYTLEDKHEDVPIPKGSKAQSVPGPGELPQSFETSDDLIAHSRLSTIKPKLSRPARLTLPVSVDDPKAKEVQTIHLKGSPSDFKPGELLLVTYRGKTPTPPTPRPTVTALFEVIQAIAEKEPNRVRLELRFVYSDKVQAGSGATAEAKKRGQEFTTVFNEIETIVSAIKSLNPAVRKLISSQTIKLKDIQTPILIEKALGEIKHADTDSERKSESEKAKELVVEISKIYNRISGKATKKWLGDVINALQDLAKLSSPRTDTQIDPKSGLKTEPGRIAFFEAISANRSLQPASAFKLERGFQSFGANMNTSFALFRNSDIANAKTFQILGGVTNTEEPDGLELEKIERFKIKAGLFGRNAPSIAVVKDGQVVSYREPYKEEFFYDTPAVPPTASAAATSAAAAARSATAAATSATAANASELAAYNYALAARNPGSPLGSRPGGPTVFGGVISAFSVNVPPTPFSYSDHIQNIFSTSKNQTPKLSENHLVLDAEFEKIINNDSAITLFRDLDGKYFMAKFSILSHSVATIRKYGISSQVSILELDALFDPQNPNTTPPAPFPIKDILTRTTVYTGTEILELASEPITPHTSTNVTSPINQAVVGLHETTFGEDGNLLELDDVYYGLDEGRWLIVQGERIDLLPEVAGRPVPSGIVDSELVMVAGAEHRFAKIGPSQDWPNDTMHTFVRLAVPLKWKFKRDTVVIYGNVVKATHGETRREVLGSGDASLAFQRFDLKQPPLTYVAAPTVAGAESTLELRVNEVRWQEAPFLTGLGANDRRYAIRIEDGGQTGVIFGDGVRGSRLPTGRENITAVYRNGIGKAGNVVANKVTVLANKPFGVKGVVNPIRASGGANRESRDQIRRNAPLAVLALDRVVSVQDYEDFARTFAGVGKASAARLVQDGRASVCVTIAGLDDIPIDPSSDLYRNLLEAFRQVGDPDQPVTLLLRDPLFMALNARVRVDPAYLFELVEPKIRAAMVKHFGFEARELGQDVASSEVLSVIQSVPGVTYVDLDEFGFVSEESLRKIPLIVEPLDPDGRITANLARLDAGKPKPAQIVYLISAAPTTLQLNEIK